MGRPELYYIEGSEAFFRSGYRANNEYNLRAAAAVQADDLAGKKLDFAAVAFRLGTDDWDRRNSGILTYTLNLTRPIQIPGEGPVPAQVINRLNYAFTFSQAERGRRIAGMDQTPIFRGVSIDNYLSTGSSTYFTFEIKLAKSGGDNTNTIVEMASRILRDPAVSSGLAATLPIVGIASAVFEVIRTTFLGSGEAKVIWPEVTIHFKGALPGTGYPLKIGRYVFVSTRLGTDDVQNFRRYRGGRLIDISNRGRVVQGEDQFYLDIYGY